MHFLSLFHHHHYLLPLHDSRLTQEWPHESKGVLTLVTHRLLIQTGTGLLGVFLPIYFYQLFDRRIAPTLLYVFLYYFLAGIVLPIGAKLMTRLGMKQALALGVAWFALFYSILLFRGFVHPFVVAGLSLCAFVVWHALYWVPYHTEFAEIMPRASLGKIISFLAISAALLGAITPAISGMIIEQIGYPFLFVAAIGLVMSSWLPLRFVPAIHEHYEYGFLQTFHILFSPAHREWLLAYTIAGAEGVVGAVIWPIFLFHVFQGRYWEIGGITTMVMGMSILAYLCVGRWLDQQKHRKLFRWGMNLTSLGWMIKAFVSTATGVFLPARSINSP